MNSSQDRFWGTVGRWCNSNPKPSIAVEVNTSGDRWPDTFNATVRGFSQERRSITLELAPGDFRTLDLRGCNVRSVSMPRPGRELVEWNTVVTFRLLCESDELFSDVRFSFTELRELGGMM